MKFEEATKAMKEGKKVIDGVGMTYRIEGCYFQYKSVDGDWRNSTIQPCHIFYDWQIVEEKKTLSDKIRPEDNHIGGEPVISAKEVKEAIKEFIDILWIKTGGQAAVNSIDLNKLIKDKSKEIFGDKLIGD